MKLLLALFVAGFATLANSQSQNTIGQQTSDSAQAIQSSVEHLTTQWKNKDHLENEPTGNVLRPERKRNSKPLAQHYQHKARIYETTQKVDGEQRQNQLSSDLDNNKRMTKEQRRQRILLRQHGERRQRRQFNAEEDGISKEGKFDRRQNRLHPDFENMQSVKGPYPRADQILENKHENYNQHESKRGEEEREGEERLRDHLEQINQQKEQQDGLVKESQPQGSGQKTEPEDSLYPKVVVIIGSRPQNRIIIRGATAIYQDPLH